MSEDVNARIAQRGEGQLVLRLHADPAPGEPLAEQPGELVGEVERRVLGEPRAATTFANPSLAWRGDDSFVPDSRREGR